jgi:energy-coupling factor transport system permease protein
MTLIPTYRKRPSALHAARAGVGAAFCFAFALAGALYRHPLILAGALGGIVVAGLAAGVGREVARSLRLALPFALLVAIVNALVYQGGDTLLVRGGEFLGRRWDVTLEAAAEGVFVGLRIVVLVAALGGLMAAAVDPDQLLKALRRVSYRSALTATLATRLVPVLARDAGRMGDARRCRPEPPRRLAVVRAALAGSLDRAVDVAAALEVRGYAGARRAPRSSSPWSRHDLRVAAAALALAAALVAGAALGAGSFDPYPRLDLALGPGELAVASAALLIPLLPFAGPAARMGVARA